MRSVPWVRDAFSRFGQRGLSIVGIHSPASEGGSDRNAVAAHARKHGLEFPQLLDNDGGYRNALGNQYWPAFYLIDRCGRLRSRAFGEIHARESSGNTLDAAIEALLAERPPDCGAR